MRSTLLCVAAVVIGLMAAGCGEDTETVTLPGTDAGIDIPIKDDEKAQVEATMDVLFDKVDFTEEVEDCARQNVDTALPPEELIRIDNLKEPEHSRQLLALAVGLYKGCQESGDNVVKQDADADTIAYVRWSLDKAFQVEFEKLGVPSAAAQCFNGRMDQLKRDDVIDLMNATTSQQVQTVVRLAKECA